MIDEDEPLMSSKVVVTTVATKSIYYVEVAAVVVEIPTAVTTESTTITPTTMER
ncbi:MAG: hypothetical protein Q8755_02695 [Candidatus Phytoplasma australasiaticum]|nr:hypothetical protein [Candidatus Phytoplasma australasiaticum]